MILVGCRLFEEEISKRIGLGQKYDVQREIVQSKNAQKWANGQLFTKYLSFVVEIFSLEVRNFTHACEGYICARSIHMPDITYDII